MYKTEAVRVGTLKLLTERIADQRLEIDKLTEMVRMLRFQKARDICKTDGQAGLEATDRGPGQRKKANTSERMASLTWG